MRFLAYAAHELRTPLATQKALLELALADPDTDVAMWREIGEDVLAACMQQEQLLDACLALARGRDRIRRRESVDIAAVAGATLRSQDQRSLTTVAALEPARTSGDPTLVERLVANLVSNAIRHNVPDGRVEVATHTTRGVPFSRSPTPGRSSRLPGPASLQALPSDSDSDAGGVGLGLTIVRAVADAHDATVTARARAGGGLGIDVSFPALD